MTITILTRPDSKAEFSNIQRQHPTITVIRQDYTIDNLRSVFHDQDAVVSATSVFTIDLQTTILDAAKAAGIKRFILNEYANSPIYQTGLPELMIYREVKDRVREYAQRLSDESVGAEGDKFTWTAIATGNLIDLSLRKYPIFGFDLQARTARLVDDGDEPFTATTLRDIGVAVRGILSHPEETMNRYAHIRSTYTTQREILDAFEAATGEKWPVSYVSSKDLLESGRKGFAAGDRKGMLDLLIAQLFEKGANRSVVVPAEKSDNELLGVEEKPISVIVEEILRG